MHTSYSVRPMLRLSSMQRNLVRISFASAARPNAQSITETALRHIMAHSSCTSELHNIVITPYAAAATISASILPICALTRR
ncbi:uncharacterized protein LAESUDRAFT_726651 [Laetiporus sulphureus 93-53]|uniref:Uncharacterized protein n=1 Tax=Laetiporus sulphureus 93-53 TaxID=1314785 RepID=A0A165DVK9_9APHY|nr:uncharacterized protein LAESUDRAFT_726651 [Laetiporus sulphureus 93-53]KZT05717.1 hypothetical protein LAESUDRAFT_726651 [Laetiporus sulphureus 93-53]